MDSFKKGFEFFTEHTGDFSGVAVGDAYINSVNGEINKFLENAAKFEGTSRAVDTLKGNLAEVWHTGTFNISAAIRGSSDRAAFPDSREFGSPDIMLGDGTPFSLKYCKDGFESAKQQAKSVFERFNEYQSRGGRESLDEYLQNRGFQDDSVLNDPVYSGQIRIIPADQYETAKQWLENKIKTVLVNRPEQAQRYQETLDMLNTKVADGKGVESIELTEEQARRLAQLAKEGKIDPKELGLTTEELVKFEFILKQAFKAGLTAAIISLILRTAPEILRAINYLINKGEVDEEQFKKIGFAAVTGSVEGFVRGTVSASITAAFKAGLLGETLKGVHPSIAGAVTVLVMDSLKNACKVSMGIMTRNEMANELIRSMFVGTCALGFGFLSQSLIHVPVLGFMIGSFAGSLAGSVAYSAAYRPAISFCVDTGFTMFGLVEQDYTLPEDVMREIGIEVFDYERFEPEPFKFKRFEFKRFGFKRFEPKRFDLGTTFLRRGVIGVNKIGFLYD